MSIKLGDATAITPTDIATVKLGDGTVIFDAGGGPTVPGTISDLAGTPGDTEVVLTWSAPSNGGSAITDYEYRVDSGTWTSTASTTPGHTVTGLTNGVSYNFEVRAVNAVGNAAASNLVAVTPSEWAIDHDFTADPVATDLPSPWVEDGWGVDATGAYRLGTGSDMAYYNQDLGSADMEVEADVVSATSGEYVVVHARRSGTNASPTCYQAFWDPPGSQYKIGRTVAGSYTDVQAGGSQGSPFTGKLTLRVVGDQISLYVDDVLTIGPVTDTNITSGNYAGINGNPNVGHISGFRAKTV